MGGIGGTRVPATATFWGPEGPDGTGREGERARRGREGEREGERIAAQPFLSFDMKTLWIEMKVLRCSSFSTALWRRGSVSCYY
jgi:hypothetical protein